MGKPYNRIEHTYNATSDTCIAFYIWRDIDTTSTAPTIQVVTSTSDLKATTEGSTADSAFTYPSGGTSGTIDASDSGINTFGELADFVNSLEGWHLLLNAAERSETYGGYLVTAAAIACKKGSAQALLWDTSTIKKHRLAVTAKHPDGANTDNGFINEVFSIVTVGTVGGGTITLNVTECDHRAGGTEATIYTETLTSGTVTSITPDYFHFTAGTGKMLLVSIDGSTHEPTSQYIELRHRTSGTGFKYH